MKYYIVTGYDLSNVELTEEIKAEFPIGMAEASTSVFTGTDGFLFCRKAPGVRFEPITSNQYYDYWDKLKKDSEFDMSLPGFDFDTEFKRAISDIEKTIASKGKEYGVVDRFHNFKVAAKIQDCTPERALDGMMVKHLVSYKDILTDLDSNVLHPNDYINEKLGDIINYFILQKLQLRKRNQESEL